MRIVFLSNYYNHHQSSFSEAMHKALNGDFYFIACESVDAERVAMGWKTDCFPSFVYQYNSNIDYCNRLVDEADVVILGSAPFNLIKSRLLRKRLTFIYSERIDKVKPGAINLLKSFIKINLLNKYKNDYYCLCASAFTSYDYSKRLVLFGKCYKWGYFPKTILYRNTIEIINSKQSEEISILFASRFIQWKHPEIPIQMAKKLKQDGIRFHLTMIGIGNMVDQVHRMIKKYCLENEITYIPSLSPEDVRKHMEKTQIFLFTSDRNEGWGAVLNEAMNSGCAVVASSEIGSVPYLLNDGINGYIYHDGSFEDFYIKVKELCLNQEKRVRFGIEAYNTITNMWNAENASKRLIELIEDIQSKGNSERYTEGPCSKASILKDNWYR